MTPNYSNTYGAVEANVTQCYGLFGGQEPREGDGVQDAVRVASGLGHRDNVPQHQHPIWDLSPH